MFSNPIFRMQCNGCSVGRNNRLFGGFKSFRFQAMLNGTVCAGKPKPEVIN